MASPIRPGSSQGTVGSPIAASPATEYPFPNISQRQYGGPRNDLRRISTSSSITSIGGTLDSASVKENAITETGQNAISTLLQQPITHTGLRANAPASSGYKAPGPREIPPVALTNIPHVEAKAFHP